MTDTASAPVRVPNVTPGARSGLSGKVIGSNAYDAYQENQSLAAQGEPITPDPELGLVVPAGDLTERVQWVSEGETEEDRAARADAVFAHEEDTDPDADLMALSEALRLAVHGEQVGGFLPPEDGDRYLIPTDLTTVDALLSWVHAGDDEQDQQARAAAVLAAEESHDGGPRKTLVEPLEALLLVADRED